jgi:hypothetical protein
MIDLSTNCVLHCKMNDNSASPIVVDDSGQEHNGLASRGQTAAWSTAGKIKTALRLYSNDNDYINYDTEPAITGTGVFCIAMWFNPQIFDTNQMLYNQRGTGDDLNGSIALYFTNQNKIKFEVCNSGYGFTFVGNTQITTSGWHLVIAQRTNSMNGELYLDNQLDGSGSGSAKTLFNKPVSIGRWNGGAMYADIVFDDTRVWNGRTLNTEERNFLWNNGLGTENVKSCTHPLVDGSLAGKRGLT